MRIAITILLAVCICSAHAQQVDKKLQNRIADAVSGFNGTVGIYVHDLKHNKVAFLNADTVFPTASIVKIPILLGIMQKIETGELNYHQRLMYRDSLFYDEGDDILSRFKDSATIELSKVMMLMITISDNCASLWLQALAGSGTRINEIIDSIGYTSTRVNSRTTGREENRRLYGWGQSSPREIAGIMEKIVRGEIYSKAASDRMLRLLGRQYWDEQALSQIPAGVFAADKTGAVNGSRNEVLYVNGKRTPYIFSIFTKNNKDQSWNENNEAWIMTRKISALLWEYYNGK
ncbi:serine hydrolase [Agriterribacter sp.]|uniref:serine hydrolase n=1 Tax=Agriterribacter sp. TaxID=2821509 RepID=UPI002C3C03A2|nr:serine hydrolase [Agriterribacter sp.]HRO46925.1 class A beta-lactamase-related serine hydrolase [Agriterribacter sp.]HRQ17419.1 class A beta-lactamase-related serine hydrolase [Agriterribacter sp.]